MSGQLIALVTALITAFATAGMTLWTKRKSSPDAVASIVSTTMELMDDMRVWNNTLLARVEALEAEVASYRAMFGPLVPESDVE